MKIKLAFASVLVLSGCGPSREAMSALQDMQILENNDEASISYRSLSGWGNDLTLNDVEVRAPAEMMAAMTDGDSDDATPAAPPGAKPATVALAKSMSLKGLTLKDGKPLLDDVRFRDRLAKVEIELMTLEITNMTFVDEVRRTGNIGPEVSMLKIRGTAIQQAITELMMQVAGPQAQSFKAIDYEGFDAFAGAIGARYFNYRKTSIYAGSNEIQRNIVAKLALGL